MKTFRAVRALMVVISLCGMCAPSVAFAVEKPTKPAIVDIALADGGTLQGKIVDLQGGSVTGLPVSMQTHDGNFITTTTQQDGRFALKGLKSGVYQVGATEGHGTYRLWSPGTAPPSAQKDAIIYTQNAGAMGGLKMFLANPIVIAGIVATAIAVPVAVANSHSSSP